MVTSTSNPRNNYKTVNFPQVNLDTDDSEVIESPPGVLTAEAARLLGDMYFPNDASLGLYFSERGYRLIIEPPDRMALGRLDTNPFAIKNLNLEPYGGAQERGVSRCHVLLHRRSNTLAIEDMDSTNGTYINGRRLKPHEPRLLHDGDEIWLGKLVVRVQFE